MTPEEVKRAILSEDELAFKKVKGIGAKTSKQIILDLKNKVAKGSGEDFAPPVRDNTLQQEALSALLALGFNKNRVISVIQKVYQKNPEINQVETLIKASLQQLSS